MAKRDEKGKFMGVSVEKVKEGLTAEEWEKAYLELQAKVARREKCAKAAVKMLMEMF